MTLDSFLTKRQRQLQRRKVSAESIKKSLRESGLIDRNGRQVNLTGGAAAAIGEKME